MSQLTVKHQKFITAYLRDGIGSKAVIEAGYSATGASVTANRLLKDPRVAAEIARRRAPALKKSELTAERVLAELANIAFLDPASLYGEDGKLLPVNKMPEEARRALAGIEESTGSRGDSSTKVRLASKLGGLELASKLLGMIHEQATQSTNVQIIVAERPSLPAAPEISAKLTPEW